MPLTQIDYQKAVIYKIQHLENEELLYVGSTTNFIKRKQHHKCICNKPTNMSYNLKVYQMIRDNGGWMQFKMIIIKEFPCNTKIELLIEEDKMMRELNSNLNNYRAHQTEDERKEYVRHYKKEYFFNNKEKEKEKAKEYRLNNKEKIKEQRQTKFICECGSYCCIENKVRHLNSLKHKQYLLINTK